MRRFLRFHGAPLLLYSAVTALLFGSVLRALPNTIPGGGDALWFLWDLWWFKHALIERVASPFITNLIFFPLTDVPVVAQTPYNELLATPGLFGLSLTLHYNLLIFASFVLSGYGAYLLVACLTRQRAVALAAGLLFAFCSYRNVRALGHLSLLTTQWMPFFFLTALQLWRRRTLRAGLVFGVMAALTALSSPYYIGIVLFPAALIGGFLLLLPRFRHAWDRRLWRAALAGGLVFALLVVPPYLHYLTQADDIYALAQELAQQASANSADLLSWLLPPPAHPLWGRWTRPIYDGFATPNGAETTVFVGLLPLALAFASFLRLRRLPRSTIFWQLLMLLTLLLSLGPSLHVAGRALLPWLPFRFFLKIPGFYLIRIPSRFGIMAALAIVVLAALVVADISRRWRPARRNLVVAAGAGLITFNMVWAFPFPTTTTTPPAYAALVRESQPGQALLTLPAGEFFFPDQAIGFLNHVGQAMYVQTVHQRPLVSGYLARRPPRLHVPEHTMPFVKRFFSQDPLRRFVDIPALQTQIPGLWPDDIQFGNEVLNQLGIAHAVIDCNAPGYPCRPATVLLTQALGAPIADEAGVQLYRTAPAQINGAPTLLTVATVTAAGGLAPADLGNYAQGWALAAQQDLTVTVPLAGVWRIYAELFDTAGQTVTLRLDDAPLLLAPLSPAAAGGAAQARYAHATLPLARGAHRLHIVCAGAQGAAQACAGGQIANVTARLISAELLAAPAPLATFAISGAAPYALHGAQVYVVQDAATQAPLSFWLATHWRTPDASIGAANADAPVLRVEFEGAHTGLAAVEQRLGTVAVWGADQQSLVELTLLPLQPDDLDRAALRITLHAPASAEAPLIVAPGNDQPGPTFALATLPQQRMGISLPPATQRESLLFTAEADARSFALLGAYITPPSACSAPTLVTIWNTAPPHQSDLSAGDVILFVHLTDGDGNLLAQADHPLGSSAGWTLGGTLLIDTVALPAAAADAEIRFGLWVPATQQRFLPADERVDDGARLRLGTIQQLTLPDLSAQVCP